VDGLMTVCHNTRKVETLEVVGLIMFAPPLYSTGNSGFGCGWSRCALSRPKCLISIPRTINHLQSIHFPTPQTASKNDRFSRQNGLSSKLFS